MKEIAKIVFFLCSETNETFDAQHQSHLQQAQSGERIMEKSGQQENYSKTQSSSPKKQQGGLVQKSDNKRGSSRAPSTKQQQQSVTTTKKAQQSNKVSKENNNTALKSASRKGHGANSRYAHYYYLTRLW